MSLKSRTAVWSRDPMSSERQADVPSIIKPRDEIDELFGRANPNPQRVGCPTHDVLVALASRERPIGDPTYEHLIACSPCYLEVRSIQEEVQQRHRRLLKTVAWSTAAAAVVVLALMTTQMFGGGRRATALPVHAELDLRPYALTRGSSQRADFPPLPLPRGLATLTMLLPAGSEPGSYQIQILNSGSRSRASAAGEAELKDHVTMLRTLLDLSGLSPGAYQLAIRRSGQEWQLFPARLE